MDYDFRAARAAEARFSSLALTVDDDHRYVMRPVLAFGVQLRLAEGIELLEKGSILDGARMVREAVAMMLEDPAQVDELLSLVDASELMTGLVALFPKALGVSSAPSPNDGTGARPTALVGTASTSPPPASGPSPST